MFSSLTYDGAQATLDALDLGTIGIGTGLGLSISYFIITENHRGEMAVESVPGVGTKFIVRLPVKGR